MRSESGITNQGMHITFKSTMFNDNSIRKLHEGS